MCTAISYKTADRYFGRTLDYEFSYGEEVVVTPRGFPFVTRMMGPMGRHYAMIGMAHMAGGYPLYYDGVNEKGLGAAGLSFPGNSVYQKPVPGRSNIASFELIPYLLGTCADVPQVREALKDAVITDTPFDEKLKPTPLHWFISDGRESIAVESSERGICVCDDPVGVLTNNPPFEQQLLMLNNYMQLSAKNPVNNFCCGLDLRPYSRGMGAMGLPGDLSSLSRFVRASFVKLNSVCGRNEEESVNQFFHILGAVEQQRGCCILDGDECEVTIYTCCCSADRGIYYYTTYGNHQITAVDMNRTDLDGDTLCRFPLITGEQIKRQN